MPPPRGIALLPPFSILAPVLLDLGTRVKFSSTRQLLFCRGFGIRVGVGVGVENAHGHEKIPNEVCEEEAREDNEEEEGDGEDMDEQDQHCGSFCAVVRR